LLENTVPASSNGGTTVLLNLEPLM